MTGNEIMSDVIIHNKYARYIGGRRENWTELVMRTASMHARKYPDIADEIYDIFGRFVLSKKVVPSMRSLQFAGKAVELSPNRMYNCAFVAMDDYHAFSETMFLLLGGSGVGYSVQKRHVSKLPAISPPTRSARYVIQDSIVGWSDAVKRLMKAYFFGEERPEFDFGDIRDKGERLITSGGKAPGPEPLKEALHKIENILRSKNYGERLSPINVFDIQCHIAEAVLSGGIRRSATICLFDKYDRDMLISKSGDWWVSNPQRAMANISAVLHRRETTREEFDTVFGRTRDSGSGEPGFVLTDDYELGVNPCAEISLRSMGFCNLTEVNGGACETYDDLRNAVISATIIGTLQAGYTDFFYLREGWKRNAEHDALLGVSITGIAGLTWVTDEMLEKLGALAIEINEEWAEIIGIRPAERVTTVKPSGTSSLVMGTSSGIHAWYAPYYARRIRLNKNEALYKYLLSEIPDLVEDDVHRPWDTAVLTVGMKAPADAVLRSESALDTFNRVLRYNKKWVASGHRKGLNRHNVSCTINVKPEEWEELGNAMWENRNEYTGISLLPYDNGTYVQAPFEEITPEEYDRLTKLVHKIDLTNVVEDEDMTDLQGELACSGGACEIG